MQTNKVLLTGGHAATSALAVIEKIQETEPKWKIMWIGTNKAFANEKATTLDFQIFPKMGVECYSIPAGKLQRKFSFSTITGLLSIPLGFVSAFAILLKNRPKVVLSWGGFVAVPVVYAAKILGIPVLIHEQTVAIGLANKLSLPVTNKVLLARKQSLKYFPQNKSEIVGLPLHKALRLIKVKKNSHPKTVFVTGGSRGSQQLNNALKVILPVLLARYSVIHHTGKLDYDSFNFYKSGLSKQLKNKYIISPTFTPQEMAENYKNADIVICRAGAHSTAEVIALQKAAIFVPIPWVQMNEQYKNALLAKKYVKSHIIDEAELSGSKIQKAINEISINWTDYMSLPESKLSERDKNAASKIVKIMEEYVQ